MTGFAARQGEAEGHVWAWEARSVNGKGLDLRLRLPDGIDGLEAAARAEAGARLARGNVTLSLRLDRAPGAIGTGLDPDAVARALAAIALIEAEAEARGVVLRDSSAAELLALRGLADTRPPEVDADALKTAVLGDLRATLDALAAMRAAEGQAIGDVLASHVDRIERLADAAASEAEARGIAQAEAFRAALSRVLENTEGADPDRVAQELALLAVKADVTEEIDRLRAHVSAARDLLAETEPVGRRLDFLSQEFNREANTLAAKSNHAPLTRVALDLKAVIDQFREQVQNVE